MRSQMAGAGARGSPPMRFVKGSRMEDDSVMSAVGLPEEEHSVISYAQFSSQRQAPVPPAPRAMDIIRRRTKDFGAGRNVKSSSAGGRGGSSRGNSNVKSAVRAQSPINMREVPGGKKRFGKFDRPPSMQESSLPKANAFGPDRRPIKRHPHEASVNHLYKELRNSSKSREKAAHEKAKITKQQQRAHGSPVQENPRVSMLSMHRSTVSPSGAIPGVSLGVGGEHIESTDMNYDAYLNPPMMRGGGAGGLAFSALSSAISNYAAKSSKSADVDADIGDGAKAEIHGKGGKEEEEEEVKEVLSSLIGQVEKQGPETNDTPGLPPPWIHQGAAGTEPGPSGPSLEELRQEVTSKEGEFERCRDIVKGWILAFEEAFGRVPVAEDRRMEKIMFRNFNIAKKEMVEAQERLEDALKASIEGADRGLVLDDVSQLTLDGDSTVPGGGAGQGGLLTGSMGAVEGNLGNGDFLVVAGEVINQNRHIQYRVLEYYGTCFSIEFLVLSTQQKWVLFVPSSNDISYLLRIWNLRANHENSIKFGDWMLRSATLTFTEDTITGAAFDSSTFRRRCNEETVFLIVRAAILVQRAWRKYVVMRRYSEALARRSVAEKGQKVASVRTAVRNIARARDAIDDGSAMVLQTRLKGASIAPARAVFTVDPRHATRRYSRKVGRQLAALQEQAPEVQLFHEHGDPSVLEALESVMEASEEDMDMVMSAAAPQYNDDSSREIGAEEEEEEEHEDDTFGSFVSPPWSTSARTSASKQLAIQVVPSSAPAADRGRGQSMDMDGDLAANEQGPAGQRGGSKSAETATRPRPRAVRPAARPRGRRAPPSQGDSSSSSGVVPDGMGPPPLSSSPSPSPSPYSVRSSPPLSDYYGAAGSGDSYTYQLQLQSQKKAALVESVRRSRLRSPQQKVSAGSSSPTMARAPASAGAVAPYQATYSPSSQPRPQPQPQPPVNQRRLPPSSMRAAQIGAPSSYAHAQAKTDTQNLSLHDEMCVFKEEVGAALSEVHREFETVKTELEGVTRVLVAPDNSHGETTPSSPPSSLPPFPSNQALASPKSASGTFSSRRDSVGVNTMGAMLSNQFMSQMEEMRDRLKVFEEELQRERQEKAAIAEQLQALSIKNQLVDTGTSVYATLSSRASAAKSLAEGSTASLTAVSATAPTPAPTPAPAPAPAPVVTAASTDGAATDTATPAPTAAVTDPPAPAATERATFPAADTKKPATEPKKAEKKKNLFGLF